MAEFDGHVAVITGAGQGIARVVADKLAAKGGKVALFDLSLERANEAAKEIQAAGGQAHGYEVDVGDEVQVRAAVDDVLDRWNSITILVNAAGSYGRAFRPTHETPADEWEAVFASNVRGTFLCAKAVLPAMMERRSGRIINFASNAGRSVSPLLGCSYTAAKTAVIGITRHLSREYATYGILVNTIAPGPTDGGRLDHLMGQGGSADELLKQLPLGRLAEPAEIADAVIFLASDSSRYVTGAILDVSGGLILA